MKFKSKYHRHRLVMRPTVFKMNEWGQREALPGREIQFDNGLFETTDPDEIRFLKASKYFGIDFVAIPESVFDAPHDEEDEQEKNRASKSEKMKKYWADKREKALATA